MNDEARMTNDEVCGGDSLFVILSSSFVILSSSFVILSSSFVILSSSFRFRHLYLTPSAECSFPAC